MREIVGALREDLYRELGVADDQWRAGIVRLIDAAGEHLSGPAIDHGAYRAQGSEQTRLTERRKDRGGKDLS